MRANELMIGDWVYSSFSNEPCQVTGIEVYGSGYGNVKVDKVVGAKEDASLTPIPLTKEILGKNGIEWSYNCGFFKEENHGFLELFKDNDGIYWSINCAEYDIIKLEFVHQLQHALSLCDIKKDIIL